MHVAEKWFNEWRPSSMAMYHDNRDNIAGCLVVFNGDVGYEVGEGVDKHTVFLDKHLCTCRSWELIGIPYAHAICALSHAKVNPFYVMSDWYHKDKFTATYKTPMQPVPGTLFMKCAEYEAIEPPPVVKLVGRPRRKRVRAPEELRSTTKLSKKGTKQKCTKCQ